MKRINFAILLFVLLNATYSYPQSNWLKIDTISVIRNGTELANPWAGGLNTFTLKNIDFDFDGDLDLLAYEDANQDLLLWENIYGIYHIKIDFYDLLANVFVEILDINNDEVPDLITSVNRNLVWYKGFKNDNKLQFNYKPQPFMQNQFLINADESPSFVDFDNDGDYDFILNDATGSFIELYTNTTTNKDNLTYEITDTCWGKIQYFYVNDSIVFNSDCITYAKTGVKNLSVKHIVPSLKLEDLNADNLYDLILTSGNISYVNIILNEGTLSSPIFNTSNIFFPSQEPINLKNRPYINKVSINDDTKNSIIFSPQYTNFGTEPNDISWLYQKDENQNYQLITKQFLVNEMLDVGKFSIPTFYDIDYDGLTDLLISNTIPNDSLGVSSQVYFYKNTGSAEIPEFTFIADDFLNLSVLDDTTLDLAFGDFDNDADEDMVVGGASGKIHYFKNEEQEFNYNGVILFKDSVFQLDFGANVSPAVIDYNEDGLADILVGKSSGKLELITNLGTTENGTPVFEITNNCFGNISTQIAGQPVGHSKPHFSGNLDSLNLYVGSTNGNIYQYNNINLLESENLLPTDTLQTNYAFVKPTSIFVSDKKQLLVTGNSRGGVALYLNQIDEILNVNTLNINNADIDIFPNPFADKIYINNNSNQAGIIEIFDSNAKMILRKKIPKSNNLNIINTNNLTTGCYIARFTTQNSYLYKKTIKY